MKVHKVSTEELDRRLQLDKRHDRRAFCRVFKTLDEAPAGFYDLQNKIRDGLEKELWANFDDGVDRSNVKSWEPEAMHTWFHLDSDMFGSDRIEMEISHTILGDKLLGVIMSHLEKFQPAYCVVAEVYNELMRGSNYLGFFVITIDEISIDESLAELWSKQVRFMEIEN
jgi:hypothetical protein